MSINYKRRQILKAGVTTLVTTTAGSVLFGCTKTNKLKKSSIKPAKNSTSYVENYNFEHEIAVLDNLQKVKNFNEVFDSDIFLSDEKKFTFNSALKRISRVKKIIGYANFNLLGFDDMLLYAHRFPQIGRFTKAELTLIDELFFYDAKNYGFYGSKVIKKLRLHMPPRVYNLDSISCKNDNCISYPSHGENIPAEFFKISDNTFICRYCEKVHTFKEIWK